MLKLCSVCHQLFCENLISSLENLGVATRSQRSKQKSSYVIVIGRAAGALHSGRLNLRRFVLCCLCRPATEKDNYLPSVASEESGGIVFIQCLHESMSRWPLADM